MEKAKQLVGCVIVDDYDRILLLHCQTEAGSRWALPGAEIESGELPETVAVRAVQEALDVEVQLVKVLGSEAFESGDEDSVYYWFQARVMSGEPRPTGSLAYDDLDYFELEDMLSLALSDNMQLLLPKIASGDVALK